MESAAIGKISAICASARVLWNEESKQWDLSGDPTEAAMLVLSQKLGFHKDILEQESPALGEIPFDYKLKYHAVLNKTDNTNTLFLSGAPEVVLNLCTTIWKRGESVNLESQKRKEIEETLFSLFKDGFRVIALASCVGKENLPREKLPPVTTLGAKLE